MFMYCPELMNIKANIYAPAMNALPLFQASLDQMQLL